MPSPAAPARALFVVALALLCSRPCSALNVVTVPQNPNDIAVPHPTYNRHATTFKAIARACAGSTVYFRWDFDGDGVWDASQGRSFSVPAGQWYAGSPYSVEGRYTYPDLDPAVGSAKLYIALVQVTCTQPAPSGLPTGPTAIGSYPVLVKAGPPWPEQAETATAADLDWMRLAAADDALWTLHKSMTRSGSGTSTITGWPDAGGADPHAAALFVLAAMAAGHRGAYPPGTYNNYGVTPPAEFLAENDWRWNSDPYAEDVIRVLNYLLGLTTSITIPAADEADDGTTPIAGTNDTMGYYQTTSIYDNEIGRFALPVAAIASSGLAGTVAQVSNARVNGKTFEYIVQQLVDYGVAAQIDASAGGSSALGGWSWTRCFGCTSSDPAVSYIAAHWVLALQIAEQQMGGSGVHVNQLVKGGLANALVRNQYSDGGPRYFDGYAGSLFEPVGGSLYGCRWLGWDAWDTSDATPTGYPAQPTTRGQARTVFNNYLAYAGANWNLAGGSTGPTDPTRGIWKDGSPADITPGEQVDIWTMSGSLLRAGLGHSGATPPVAMVGAHDWRRDFAMSLVEGGNDSWALQGGWYYQEPGPSFLYNAAPPILAPTGHALLMAAKSGNAAPVAGLSINPCNAGSCAGDCCEAALANVSFLAMAYDLDGTISSVSLDFGDGSPPVSMIPGNSTVHQYTQDGTHSAILTVTDNSAATSADTVLVVVTGASGVAAPPEPSARLRLHAASPNPFQWTTRVAFDLPAECRVTVDLLDLSGRLVRTLSGPVTLPRGRHEASWDGRDALGRQAAPGVYFCRLRAGKAVQVERIALTR